MQTFTVATVGTRLARVAGMPPPIMLRMAISAIDLASGTVTVDGVPVGPGLTRSAFLASPLGATRQDYVSNEPHRSWKVLADVGGRSFSVVLLFTGEHLAIVQLVLKESTTPASWADWSEQEELAIKAAHDGWLRDQCGVIAHACVAWDRLAEICGQFLSKRLLADVTLALPSALHGERSS